MDKTIYTPKTFLKNVVTEGKFDVTFTRREKRGNVNVDYLYFNGNGNDEGITRVYCVIAYGKLPSACIVKIGEIGKPIDVDELVYFAVRGFTACAIDYAGDMGVGLHTVYPAALEYGNLLKAHRRLEYVDDTARQTTWYEWDYNTLRLLDYLQHFSFVEDGKIALYSVGEHASRVAMHVLCSDKRVKSGAVAFGNIWDETLRNIQQVQQLSITELTQSVEELDEEERWLSAIAPQSYLPHVTQPLYLVTGANSTRSTVADTHAGMERCKNPRSRHLYMGGIIDRITAEVLKNIAEWFKVCFKGEKEIPKEPHLTVRAKEKQLYCALHAHEGQSRMYYTRKKQGNKSQNWNEAITLYDDKWVKGKIDVYDAESPITAYATVTVGSLSLSTDPVTIVPSDYDIHLSRPDKVLYEGERGVDAFISIALNGKEAYTAYEPVKSALGPYGIRGIQGSQMGTFAVSEYPFDPRDSFLMLDAYSQAPQPMTCTLVVNWGKEEQESYSKRLELSGGELWQKVRIELKDFKTASGKQFDKGLEQVLCLLCFDLDSSVILNNILFG